MYITTNIYYNQCILQPMYIAHLPPTSTGQGSGLGFTSYIQFKPIINFWTVCQLTTQPTDRHNIMQLIIVQL